MKTHIFIQARMGSRRLPGKVLKKIMGKTVVNLILERLKNVQDVDEIFLVTGPSKINGPLINEAKYLKLKTFCGNEINVLDRFYKASIKFESDAIIRITADCPLIDYDIINKGLKIFKEINCDILSIVRKRSFPHGFDFEIFKNTALATSWNDMLAKYQNEDEFLESFIPPTKNMLEKKKFNNYELIHSENLSKIRLTMDYPEDFEVIREIYQDLYKKNKFFGMKEILKFLEENSKILEINQKYVNFNHELDIEK